MLGPLTLRTSRLVLARAGQTSARRAIATTPVRRADLVQELYLKELKNYKIPAVKPSDAEGQVQKFSMPKAPQSPEQPELASSLKEYEAQVPEVEGQSAEGEAAPVEQDWFEEPEDDEAPAHH
ncbi:putative mitochondrial F1F0 ATP synthase subunit Atp14 [Piedraia hortae CBS 480.64]|uniref:Putative mitochondrial F1F0 ATP synthase subunit Atp14 n=1 Tax=Piedraia hortae CBS 480.64 TaxID=1314780 RepID=A0A6A7C0Q9_9PEZI|nr:putative mitochondrial F1F0 ATP synthase subunit Atp14 [Piedraia hortae CBS 480.64]